MTAALGETFIQIAYLAIGFCLYLTRQGVAICATTILQEEVDDAYRGRVFAFYDMMFNVTYVAGAALSAAFMPANGHSPVIVAPGGRRVRDPRRGVLAVPAHGSVLVRLRVRPGGRRDDPLGRRPAQQLLSGPLPAELALASIRSSSRKS